MPEDEVFGQVGSGGREVAVATAVAPAYLEGDAGALSVDLSGQLRLA